MQCSKTYDHGSTFYFTRLEIPCIKYRQAQETVRPMFYYEKGKLALETVHICTNVYFPKRKHILVVETLYLLRNDVIMRFRPHNRCRYFIYVISSRVLP